MNRSIHYVKEIWMDKEQTLQQGIMYKYGDERDMNYHRSHLNPHVTELALTFYLNKNMKVIYIRKENKDGKEEEI